MNRDVTVPFEVIERFALKNDLTLDFSVQLHEEMVTFLDKSKSENPDDHIPSMLVDEAWHAFILHTKFYNSFCKARYGHFVHHIPMSKKFDQFSRVKEMISFTPSEVVSKDSCSNELCTDKCRCSDCESKKETFETYQEI